MEYLLQFDIGHDDEHWVWETFQEERQNLYKKIMQQFPTYKSRVHAVWLEFLNADPTISSFLIEFAKSNQYVYSIGSKPVYSQDEIRKAQFVPFLIEGKYDVGHDKNDVHLNDYKKVICDKCGRVDYGEVPNPYYIDKKAMGTYRDIYKAGLGVIIFSEKAFRILWEDINDYVICGDALVEKNGQILEDAKRKYYWIRPKYKVGSYYNSVVEEVCEVCKKPTIVRKEFINDSFLMNVEMISSYNNVDAPVVLAGNWFGNITSSPYGISHDIFISGWLHEKIKNLKLKGHVEADCLIHSTEEFDTTNCKY